MREKGGALNHENNGGIFSLEFSVDCQRKGMHRVHALIGCSKFHFNTEMVRDDRSIISIEYNIRRFDRTFLICHDEIYAH